MRPWIALILFAGFASAARQPFAAEDVWNWRTASDPRISPDGQQVLWVESWNDRESNAVFSNILQASVDGKGRQSVTEGKWRDTLPRWSLDSERIAWVSQRGEKIELRVRKATGGPESTIALDSLPVSLAWSANGEMLAFVARVAVARTAPWAPPAILERLRQPEPGPRLFVVSSKGGAVRPISAADVELRGEPSWMPDGQSILIAREGGIDAIKVADGAVRSLLNAPGRYWAALASPDGSKVGYVVSVARPQSYAVRKLYVMNADGSRGKLLAGQLDRDVSDPQWSSDSRTLYFLADDHGISRVYAARNEGTARQVTQGATDRFRGFSLADDGRAATIRSTATESGKAYTFTVDHVTQPVTLGATNQRLEAERDLGAVEEISYPSEARTIQAWLVKPPGFDSARKYPLVLDIADAPRRMLGPELDLRAQVLAARGYIVLLANPRGAPGYGEEFGNLLPTRYPGDDFDDLLRGVEFAAARPYVDGSRLYVTGGLVAAWAIGHTERFRAAVLRKPVGHWTTTIATAPDGLRRAADWLRALPWDDPDQQYSRRSPVSYASAFKTPTLILAGESDAGSDELYFALQALKVESALARIAGERPADSVLELEATLAWFAK